MALFGFLTTSVHSVFHSIQFLWFKLKYLKNTSVCGKCNHCFHNISGKQEKNCLVEAINETIASLKLCSKQLIIFFDNLDKIIESDLKDCLLYFIHELNEKCSKIKLVFCSSNEAHCCHKSYGRFVLGALDERSILNLIYLTTESSDDASTTEYDGDITKNEADQKNSGKKETLKNFFKRGNKYFNLENKVYMEKIATLCEGHPLAAIICGILTPAELMEILTESRQEVLGPDHCPPEGRLDMYDTPLQKIKSIYRVLVNEKRIALEG